MLYAYGGLTAISEVRAIVGGDPKGVRKSIVAGTLLAAGLTILFVTAVIGSLGPETTQEAVGGLNRKFDGSLTLVGAIAGFFSIVTSYIVFSEYLKSQFNKDFRWPKPVAVAVARAGIRATNDAARAALGKAGVAGRVRNAWRRRLGQAQRDA